MNNPLVWIPLVTALAGFLLGALIGHATGEADGEARAFENFRRRRNGGAR